MNQNATTSAPYIRILHVDVMRGWAVLGIYLVNIFIFALPYNEVGLGDDLNDNSPLNLLVRMLTEDFVEGSMRSMFSILFGASALIFLDEARLAVAGLQLVDYYYRRTLLLVLFGLIHAYWLLWPYDVLYAYGLFGLFLFPLRVLSARTLAIIGICLLVFGGYDFNQIQTKTGSGTVANVDVLDSDDFSGLSQEPDQPGRRESTLSEPKPSETPNQFRALATRLVPPGTDQDGHLEDISTEDISADELIQEPNPDKQADINALEVNTYLSGYSDIYHYQLEQVEQQQSSYVYKYYIFDIGGMMLLGMALFKLGVLSGKLTRRMYWMIAVAGLLLGIASRGALAYADGNMSYSLFEPIATHLGTSYNLSRLFMVLGYIGLLGLLCSFNWLSFIARILAAVGRMALTSYIMQTVISLFLFYGFGLGLFFQLERYQLVLVCVGVWIFQILFSILWLIWFRQGPLEWLWRSLIYGSRQPLLKAKGVDSAH
ncbi:MAG: DUF418 domain-containing protein [Gammaproteobacteria bacterium]|nr:DUF418 domain-containing protein [Gammaproteobacteria bacterium]MDH5801856.1 DUF418 domain-containing protein [Gammaproteobacteria bacterium]